MLERGIYLPLSGYEASFLSLAHSDEDIDRTIESAKDALRTLAKA
jgi:glutamate-1-semialdehyde 2,1-aminomutase